jgi:hypothetical protein
VLGEAKRAAGMLDPLIEAVRHRFSEIQPSEETRRRGDEARQLAWRLWLTRRAPYVWLIGPGVRRAYRCSYAPLAPDMVRSLPTAQDLRLSHPPAAQLAPPALQQSSSTETSTAMLHSSQTKAVTCSILRSLWPPARAAPPPLISGVWGSPLQRSSRERTARCCANSLRLCRDLVVTPVS